MVKILRENNELKQMPLECIKGATLLSTEETENLLTQDERKCAYQGEPCWWWLRTPGDSQHSTTFVGIDGSVFFYGGGVGCVRGCVRPALTISNLSSSKLRIGDIFEFGDYKFKIISNMYALCEEVVGQCAFRENWKTKDANVYESSDIKKFVDNWFNASMQDMEDISRGQKTDSMIADENDLGF